MLAIDVILPSLHAQGRKQVFQAIAEEAALLLDSDENVIFEKLLEREKIGSTAIGSGVAIPHIKMEGIDRIYGIMARLDAPVSYDTPDDGPVDLVFVLIAPAQSKTTLHLRALAQISRLLKDSDTRKGLRGALDKAAMESVIQDWLQKQAA